MYSISIIEVNNDTLSKLFVRFPFELYKDNPYYVPPLINDELNIWNPKENAALDYSVAKRFLAYKNDKIVGRIAIMINHKEAKELGINKVRFGWFDFINDIEVSKALINKAIDFANENNISMIEGPMGFTNLDKAGMLTYGYNKIATMIGLYNYEYYPKHMEELGFTTEKEWIEYEMDLKPLSEKVIKFNELIKKKYRLKVINFKSKKEILPYVEPMFKLLDETYKTLSSYTPISNKQIQTYKEKYFNFINKDYITCIADENDKLIAFAITMPSYSKALQKAKGKLFPFGWWHFLQAGKKNDRANFYLIGIHPEYQRRGVTAIIFKAIDDNFRKKGVKYLETNPELIENKSVQLLWADYNPTLHKKRKTFSIQLNQ